MADVEGAFTGVLHRDSQPCYLVQRFMACTVVVVIHSMYYIIYAICSGCLYPSSLLPNYDAQQGDSGTPQPLPPPALPPPSLCWCPLLEPNQKPELKSAVDAVTTEASESWQGGW